MFMFISLKCCREQTENLKQVFMWLSEMLVFSLFNLKFENNVIKRVAFKIKIFYFLFLHEKVCVVKTFSNI